MFKEKRKEKKREQRNGKPFTSPVTKYLPSEEKASVVMAFLQSRKKEALELKRWMGEWMHG